MYDLRVWNVEGSAMIGRDQATVDSVVSKAQLASSESGRCASDDDRTWSEANLEHQHLPNELLFLDGMERTHMRWCEFVTVWEQECLNEPAFLRWPERHPFSPMNAITRATEIDRAQNFNESDFQNDHTGRTCAHWKHVHRENICSKLWCFRETYNLNDTTLKNNTLFFSLTSFVLPRKEKDGFRLFSAASSCCNSWLILFAPENSALRFRTSEDSEPTMSSKPNQLVH